MAFRYWKGNAGTTAQVSTGSIDSVDTTPANNTFTVTIAGVAISQVGTVNVATTAAALVVLLNASKHVYFSAITWTNPSAGTIVATADTAGVAFIAVLTATGAGTGAVTDFAATTANSGPNDYGTAANWYTPGADAAVPGVDDDVVIPPGTVAILYGLNQSAVAIDSFRVLAGYTGAIGGTNGWYLQLNMGASEAFEFAGTGIGYIDLGASNVDPIVRNSAAGATGTHGLYLKATALSDLILLKGNVGFGVDEGDITSEVDNIVVGQVGSQASDVALTIGTNVHALAWVAETPVSIVSITQNGGTVVNRATVATVKKYNGTYTQEDGNWTTLNSYGGTTYTDSDGTYDITNIFNGSSVLNTRDLRAKTFTNTTIQKDGTLNDPAGKIVFTNPTTLEDCGLGDVTLVSGKNQTITITAI